ncbi:MAG: FAD-dependent oxidoreductase, partial [Saprospiraceae bacterium]|nr:FAD-dependent oxidoreductase [Saprospiraceae bacterium]
MKTACVDNWKGNDGKPSLGGTCLNVGCIPSKALLDSSEHYYQLTHHFSQHGISTQKVSIDIATMLARKDKIVSTLTQGVKTLFDANKIVTFHGRGKLVKPNQVEVADGSETKLLDGKHIILATGSRPVDIPVAKVDQESILDSTGALSLQEVPKHLGVIGAGVIGLELGSVWRRLGSEVTILEAVDQFLPAADRQIAQDAQRVFKQQGLQIQLGCQVTGSKVKKNGVQVEYKNKDGEQSITVDRLIVAVGRKPNTDNLIAPGINIGMDSRGFIEVDGQCRTAISNVYAIGDSVRGPMLAHKGSEEGVMVAELIAGQTGHINYEVIPWVIYTWPEIAWTGRTEQQLKQDGIAYNVGMFPMGANGRALAMGETG